MVALSIEQWPVGFDWRTRDKSINPYSPDLYLHDLRQNWPLWVHYYLSKRIVMVTLRTCAGLKKCMWQRAGVLKCSLQMWGSHMFLEARQTSVSQWSPQGLALPRLALFIPAPSCCPQGRAKNSAHMCVCMKTEYRELEIPCHNAMYPWSVVTAGPERQHKPITAESQKTQSSTEKRFGGGRM